MATPPSGKEESGDRFDFLVSPLQAMQNDCNTSISALLLRA